MQNSAPRQRTLPITILAVLAAVAGISAVIDMLRFMGILGKLNFYTTSWLGAVLAAILALIWFTVAAELWRLDARGWLFVVMVATLNIVFLVLSLFSSNDFQAIWFSLLINVVALALGLLPSTKAAFGVPTTPATTSRR